jgi:poly-gamma-glutamate synthase PgsB/CapB
MNGFYVLCVVTAILVLAGLIEGLRHNRRLRQIPLRIHVNGTRGKSSVARLIAAGLRAGGIRTCCKTTGTLPRLVLPDGREYPVFRPSRANIIEQVRIVDRAATLNVHALVIECMALQPRLQWLCESRLIRSTHGVITNARADHLDVMGPAEDDVARALAGSVCLNGTLFTAERRHLDVFHAAAADRGTELIATTDADLAAVTELDMSRFSYVEHAENVALALKVCESLGVDRHVALRGMWQATPDPGVMKAYRVEFFGRHFIFVNGFAANDPESTERIWDLAIAKFPDVQRRIALFNCRSDRPDRSRQLGTACAAWQPADHYVLMGTGTFVFARTAAAGLKSSQITFAEDMTVAEIFETVAGLAGSSALIMGMGNIGGLGLSLTQYYANRSSLEQAV